MLILGAMFYIGNRQEYTDASLSFILYADMLCSLIQAVLIAYGIVLMVIRIIRTKQIKALLYLLHYAGAFILTALSLSLSSILNYLQN